MIPEKKKQPRCTDAIISMVTDKNWKYTFEIKAETFLKVKKWKVASEF